MNHVKSRLKLSTFDNSIKLITFAQFQVSQYVSNQSKKVSMSQKKIIRDITYSVKIKDTYFFRWIRFYSSHTTQHVCETSKFSEIFEQIKNSITS